MQHKNTQNDISDGVNKVFLELFGIIKYIITTGVGVCLNVSRIEQNNNTSAVREGKNTKQSPLRKHTPDDPRSSIEKSSFFPLELTVDAKMINASGYLRSVSSTTPTNAP